MFYLSQLLCPDVEAGAQTLQVEIKPIIKTYGSWYSIWTEDCHKTSFIFSTFHYTNSYDVMTAIACADGTGYSLVTMALSGFFCMEVETVAKQPFFSNGAIFCVQVLCFHAQWSNTLTIVIKKRRERKHKSLSKTTFFAEVKCFHCRMWEDRKSMLCVYEY